LSQLAGAQRPRAIVPGVPATVIVGAQWGDEGKGKIVDLLAQNSDVVCRYQGGPNAGHTIVVGDETYKIRALPSGIVRGKPCVIGNGCVVDPEVLIGELDEFERRGHSTDEVYVSGNAHLIMPWHLAIDQASERRLGKLAIGTTRRGIGPCYADKAMRLGIRVQDILDPKILRQKIEVALAEKNLWLERVYETKPFDLETVAAQYEDYAQRLRPYVADTSLYVDTALRGGKQVLFEGAQATLLDLDHGTYPFVTSSNPVAASAATGTGIGPQRIDRVVGVAKAYVTRVGEGPFPSEIAGPEQARMRELGGEYGTVTGRERRCGWLDLVALRYAVRVNGIDQLALTKLDVLSHFAELPVCIRYRTPDGSETSDFPAHQSDFHAAKPVYEVLDGWTEPLDGCASAAELPGAARSYVEFVERELDVEVTLVGTGADRASVLTRA
jgi:adenylosuccinate synthase